MRIFKKKNSILNRNRKFPQMVERQARGRRLPSGAHVEQGEGLRDVVRVHGVEDDGGRGEEGEQEDEEEVEDEAARPPAHALHREILPRADREGRRTGDNVVSSVRTGNDHTGRCFNHRIKGIGFILGRYRLSCRHQFSLVHLMINI